MPTPFDEFYEDAPPPDEDASTGMINAGGMAAGAALLALLRKNPAMLKGSFEKLNAIRQQLMLSGLAVPKSILGNVGAATAMSLENRSLAPLKELLSTRTLKDATAAYRRGASVGPMAGSGTTLPGPNPGKIMGAMDDATQSALQRSGASADDAASAVFQTPLSENFGPMSKLLESPTARYVLPFRRTPFNQFAEGLKTLDPNFAHKGVRNAYAGVGAAHGAATAEEEYPVTVPLATAGAAKYGLPYGGAAIIGRFLAGGKGGGGVAGTMLPVSEYGVEQSLTDPFAPFYEPAITRVGNKF